MQGTSSVCGETATHRLDPCRSGIVRHRPRSDSRTSVQGDGLEREGTAGPPQRTVARRGPAFAIMAKASPRASPRRRATRPQAVSRTSPERPPRGPWTELPPGDPGRGVPKSCRVLHRDDELVDLAPQHCGCDAAVVHGFGHVQAACVAAAGDVEVGGADGVVAHQELHQGIGRDLLPVLDLAKAGGHPKTDLVVGAERKAQVDGPGILLDDDSVDALVDLFGLVAHVLEQLGQIGLVDGGARVALGLGVGGGRFLGPCGGGAQSQGKRPGQQPASRWVVHGKALLLAALLRALWVCEAKPVGARAVWFARRDGCARERGRGCGGVCLRARRRLF